MFYLTKLKAGNCEDAGPIVWALWILQLSNTHIQTYSGLFPHSRQVGDWSWVRMGAEQWKLINNNTQVNGKGIVKWLKKLKMRKPKEGSVCCVKMVFYFSCAGKFFFYFNISYLFLSGINLTYRSKPEESVLLFHVAHQPHRLFQNTWL